MHICVSALITLLSSVLLLVVITSTEARSVDSLGVASNGPIGSRARDLHKRSFTGLGCLGVYDKSKFARLDRVCEECYQLYREPELHGMCRRDCFRNEIFSKCVDALLLSHEQKSFEEMVSDLYGK